MKKTSIILSAVITLMSFGIYGETFSVTTTTTGGIQGVIDVASDGDVIEVAAGVYEISSPIRITKSLTLAGEGRDQTIVRLANGIKNFRVLELTSSATMAVVEGVTFSGGYFNSTLSGICAFIEAGTVQDCTFSDSYIIAWGGGGGVYLKGANSKLLRCIIRNCRQNYSALGAALAYAENNL